MESEVRPTGVRLKRKAKHLTGSWLNSKHPVCCITFEWFRCFTYQILCGRVCVAAGGTSSVPCMAALGVECFLQDKTRSIQVTILIPIDIIAYVKVKIISPWSTPYIRLVKFQLVRQIPDVYVGACVLAGKLFCCILHRIPKLFMV